MSDLDSTTTPATRGRLVLVPAPLDFGVRDTPPVPLDDVLPRGVMRRAAALGHWVVENARSARAFLKRVDALEPLAQPLQTIDIVELPRPRKGGATTGSDAAAPAALLAPALQGHDVGLLSEAGLPAVADPGAAVVQAAHRLGLVVEPLAGASSLLLALAASGLNGQSFAFTGYLPVEADRRAEGIRALETLSRKARQTQIVIETPYRNAALLGTLLATLQPATQLAVACGLTLTGGWTRSDRVADWRSRPGRPLPDDVPAVFALLAG